MSVQNPRQEPADNPPPSFETLLRLQTDLLQKMAIIIGPWKLVVGLLCAVVGLIGALVAQRLTIQSAAKQAVTEGKFLGELAAMVRPGCIFDGKGVIKPADNFGAAELIDSIDVKPIPGVGGFKITLKFKKHLRNEPIVTGLNVNVFQEQVEQGPDNTWTFSLTPALTIGPMLGESREGLPWEIGFYKFKLEILH